MKFKLLSLVLLLACFVFLGVLAGVIPVAEPGVAVFAPVRSSPAAASPEPEATQSPLGTSRSVTPPSPRAVGTAAPVSTAVIAGPTGVPATATDAPTPAETASSPSAAPITPAPAAASPAAASPAPTASPAPAVPITAGTPVPVPSPAAAVEDSLGWEPDAAVISTTITWNDPLQNDTDREVDGQALLHQEPDIVLPAQGAQILIIHTHGTEAYTPDGSDHYEATADYRTTDPAHTVIRVGEALGEALESYGLRVIVDKSLYDWPSYNGSYGRAEAAIQEYLARYPDLAMIIDLHRDALGDGDVVYKTVSDALTEPAAQMMFVVGTDENLDHPKWRENLAFAMSLQGLVEEQYPHLMRPTLLCPYRYNQQYSTGSVLLEIGTAGNTLEEAITAAELFADAVGPVLAEKAGA